MFGLITKIAALMAAIFKLMHLLNTYIDALK
jgi:hypothetical protein